MNFRLDIRDFAAVGVGPSVAIVDSGVHATHPHVQGVAGGISIDATGALHHDYVDRLGHGTAVAAVIREKAPTAELFCLKVFDRELATTNTALVAALQWARSRRTHLVNLSLGTINTDHEAALAAEIAHAIDDGMVILSAAPQDGHRWLPGALHGVIAVELDMAIPRDACEIRIADDGAIRARASGYPRPIPGVPPEKNLRGVSFAVANVSGVLARAWPDWPAALSRPPARG